MKAMVKRAFVAMGFFAMLLLTIGAGAYSSDYGKHEMVHFRLAVPAGEVNESKVIRGAGAPVEMAPIRIDLAKRGLPKNIFNREIEGISTHWISNVGKKPVRIRMELVNSTTPIRWEVNANLAYDPATRTFTEPLPPGKSIPNLGLDWFFDVPDSFSDGVDDGTTLIYDGGLALSDADTGELLTFLPITIGRGLDAQGGAAACH
jgi:hypothetical protein